MAYAVITRLDAGGPGAGRMGTGEAQVTASTIDGLQVRRGVGRWLSSYLVMLRFDLARQGQMLVALFFSQLLLGVGSALMYGFYLGPQLDDLDPALSGDRSSGPGSDPNRVRAGADHRDAGQGQGHPRVHLVAARPSHRDCGIDLHALHVSWRSPVWLPRSGSPRPATTWR